MSFLPDYHVAFILQPRAPQYKGLAQFNRTPVMQRHKHHAEYSTGAAHHSATIIYFYDWLSENR